MKILLDSFAGMIPAIHPGKLPMQNASSCSGCFFDRGVLQPMRNFELATNTVLSSGAVLGMHRTENGTWQLFDFPVSVCRSPIADNEHYLMTGTGISPRQFTDTEAASNEYRPLGLPYPPSAPDIEISGTGDGTIDVSVSYVYTYVTDQGEESANSYPTAVIEVEEGQSVLLTGLSKSTVPLSSTVTTYRIYRLQSGTSGADYMLVGETPSSNNSFTDADPGSDLDGDVLATSTWIAPDDDLQGLISFGQGTYAGFVDKDVYVSETFVPYAWPSGYSRSVNAEIVGLAPVSGGFYALTTDKPVLFTGSDPATLYQQELGAEYACSSARSIASTDAGVIYATERGLAFLGYTGDDRLLTSGIYTDEQWEDLFTDHTAILGTMCNGDYVFCEQGGDTIYTLDVSAGTIVPYTLDTGGITCLWYDRYTSTLYISRQTSGGMIFYILSWQTDSGDSGHVEYEWVSKEMDIPQGACLSCGKIIGGQSVEYPVTLSIRVDGSTNWVLNQSITSEDAFRLPSGRHTQFQITLSGKQPVQGVLLATSMGELNVG